VLLQAIEEVLSDAIDVDLDVSLAEHDLQKRAACRVNLRAITDDDTVLGVLGCVVDVTELRSMATTDGLTGLQNRRSILDALSSEMEGNDGHVAAIYLDLDLFKPVNDRYGHHVGDQLLKAVAERLRGRIRASDQAARLGGDEFLVICPGIDDHEEGLMLARRVQSAFNDPFHVVRTPISITASVGVTCGAPGVTAEELVTSADGAMYEAKRSRGGPPVFRELARPQAPQIMGGSADY
jgi:diguanylate cyclase (GGDEF)-like protein